jgi:hypothetical protein
LRTSLRHLPLRPGLISSQKRSWAFPFRGFPFDHGQRSYPRLIPSCCFRRRRPPFPCSARLGSSAIHGAVSYRVLSVVKVRSHDPIRLDSGSGRSPPGFCFLRGRVSDAASDTRRPPPLMPFSRTHSAKGPRSKSTSEFAHRFRLANPLSRPSTPFEVSRLLKSPFEDPRFGG